MAERNCQCPHKTKPGDPDRCVWCCTCDDICERKGFEAVLDFITRGVVGEDADICITREPVSGDYQIRMKPEAATPEASA